MAVRAKSALTCSVGYAGRGAGPLHLLCVPCCFHCHPICHLSPHLEPGHCRGCTLAPCSVEGGVSDLTENQHAHKPNKLHKIRCVVVLMCPSLSLSWLCYFPPLTGCPTLIGSSSLPCVRLWHSAWWVCDMCKCSLVFSSFLFLDHLEKCCCHWPLPPSTSTKPFLVCLHAGAK